MTVSTTSSKVSYSGNGSTTVFAYSFKILENSDLVVLIRTDSTGVEVTQTITTNYTVSGAGSASGGNVTMVTAPASGETLVIKRVMPLTQATDYTPNDPFPAASHEDALDKLTFISQQHQETFDRAIVLPATDTASTTIPNSVDRANKYLAFDANGNVTSTAGTADVTPISAAMDDVVGASTLNTARTEFFDGTNLSFNTANTITTTNTDGDLTLTPNGTGTVVVSTDLDVDNINLNGNTISSTDTNGDVIVDPNGSGNLKLSGAAMALTNGGTPGASITDGVLLFAEDVSSSSELRVRDEAGNVTTLSPHNFDLIPTGASEEMAWSYYSEKDGNRINVDMLRALRVLEQISGEKLVYTEE